MKKLCIFLMVITAGLALLQVTQNNWAALPGWIVAFLGWLCAYLASRAAENWQQISDTRESTINQLEAWK